MSKRAVVVCPHCKRGIETYPPDPLHPYYSVEKPEPRDVSGTIIERVYDCENPNCCKPFTTYWWDRKRFFERG